MTTGESLQEAQAWFAQHVSLNGQAYTLDLDQTRAAIDSHFNTLVTARAGSGKTRVIVAKVAYLVAHRLAKLSEIMIFMFNRTAADEVNQRIADILIDGHSLVKGKTVHVASTFHKFAYDLVKQTDGNFQLLSETEHDLLIRRLLRQTLLAQHQRLNKRAYLELLSIVNSFITRAGQKYPGCAHLPELKHEIESYISEHRRDPSYRANINYHKVSFQIYQSYLDAVQPPKIDFNLLMARATAILNQKATSSDCPASLSHLKFIMIDEYQDFSYLFYALVCALRRCSPAAKLFAVGDDWQAINRFAGSDVSYFIDFARFFPQDSINIPLATNYRSCRRIVENANQYMLQHYDSKALPAIPFQKQSGKIIFKNPNRTRFDLSDIYEDGLGDGRYYHAVANVQDEPDLKAAGAAARLLKSVTKIIAHRPEMHYLLLHRHNFMSYKGISLAGFTTALRDTLIKQGIMSDADFTQRVRSMTMHKSKGLESEVVILLEMNRDLIHAHHPHATIFEIFGDTEPAENADRHRLLYVALTRAKKRLFLLTNDPDILA